MNTRKLVGWAVRDTPHADIALGALDRAIKRQRPSPGRVHHGDRGVQYAADAYRQALAAAGLTPSMGRKGACLDNASMERFLSLRKAEMVHRSHVHARSEAKAALFEHVAIFYNRQRRNSRIGCRTPERTRIDMTRAEAPS